MIFQRGLPNDLCTKTLHFPVNVKTVSFVGCFPKWRPFWLVTNKSMNWILEWDNHRTFWTEYGFILFRDSKRFQIFHNHRHWWPYWMSGKIVDHYLKRGSPNEYYIHFWLTEFVSITAIFCCCYILLHFDYNLFLLDQCGQMFMYA